jgi:TolB protein
MNCLKRLSSALNFKLDLKQDTAMKVLATLVKALFLFTITLLYAPLLQAEVRIVITEGAKTARPIAVVPFKWQGAGEVPQDISAIIASDLRHSGLFNPLAINQLPQRPSTVSALDPACWRALGIDTVVIGQIQPGKADHFLISYQLIDVTQLSRTTGSVLEQNQCQVTAEWLRYAAHRISDSIFEKLTALKGAFNTRIAYVVQTHQGQYPYELRLSDYDGHHQKTIYRSSAPMMSLAWSPDGRQLAYVTFEHQRSELILHDLASKKRKQLAAFPRHNGAPAFSFDGTKLALALSKGGSLKIYLLDLKNEKMIRLTEGLSNDTEPAWHPDGRSLIFTSDRGGHPEIYQIQLADSQIQRLTWEGLQNQGGKISPDGRSLIMVNRGSDGYHIAKQDLETGRVQVLTSTFLDQTPSISPNGTMIIYSSTEQPGKVLQLVSMDGRFKARLLATEGQVKFPAWSPYLQ